MERIFRMLVRGKEENNRILIVINTTKLFKWIGEGMKESVINYNNNDQK